MFYLHTKFHDKWISRFQRSCNDKVIYKYFLSSKGHNSNKNEGIKISCRYALLHMMFYLHTKFHDNWISSFRGVAMTRFWDGRTDGRTDWRSDCTPRPALPSATQVKSWEKKFQCPCIAMIWGNCTDLVCMALPCKVCIVKEDTQPAMPFDS